MAASASSPSHLRFSALHRRGSPNTNLPSSTLRFHNPHPPKLRLSIHTLSRTSPLLAGSGGGDDTVGGNPGGGGGGGDDGDDAIRKSREEALLALAAIGRSLESIPADLAAAVVAGRIPGVILHRFAELEKSAISRWLMQFAGFKERLLADDMFLAKVGMECSLAILGKIWLVGALFLVKFGVERLDGVLTETAAEYERLRENFVIAVGLRENFVIAVDVAIANVVMAVITDFMLVWLSAPTVSLRPPLAISAGAITKFFHNCPDNAFQVALGGTSYSFLQRIVAIVRNGSKLFVVGTSTSLIGTGIKTVWINSLKAFAMDQASEGENLPILSTSVLSTSVAYGVYMAVSSNLRYQVLAGVVEQRMLEPLLRRHKFVLGAICFAVRTGNTFLGFSLWVDCASWVDMQKSRGGTGGLTTSAG